jgi:hypothetical protein
MESSELAPIWQNNSSPQYSSVSIERRDESSSSLLHSEACGFHQLQRSVTDESSLLRAVTPDRACSTEDQIAALFD